VRTYAGIQEGSEAPQGTEPGMAGPDTPADGCIPFRLRTSVVGHQRIPEGAELRRKVRIAIEEAVIRNSDVLIARWDGQHFQGVGGTADMIRRMREHDRRLARSEPSAGIRSGPIRAGRAHLPAGLISPVEPVFAEAGPLRTVFSVNGDHEIVTDDGPPWDVGATAVRQRLRSDLQGLDELNRKKLKDWPRSAAINVNDLVSAEYRSGPRLNRLAEWIAPPLTRTNRALMAAHKAFLRISYSLSPSDRLPQPLGTHDWRSNPHSGQHHHEPGRRGGAR
jgi:hypothetical protein